MSVNGGAIDQIILTDFRINNCKTIMLDGENEVNVGNNINDSGPY